MSRITEDDAGQDYYRLLGVDPIAHPAIIKGAYRANMSELNAHPDRGGVTETATLLNRAREVLLDPGLRRECDRIRTIRGYSPRRSPVTEASTPPSGSRESVPRSPVRNREQPRSRPWLVLVVAGTIALALAVVAISHLAPNPVEDPADVDVWAFPAPSLPTIKRGDNVMYDLGDGFYGLRMFRQGRWIARVDVPERFQDDMRTAVKMAILKSLRVGNTAQYDRPDVCVLSIRITGRSGAVGCPVQTGITAEAQLVWKTDDGHTAFIIVLRHLE